MKILIVDDEKLLVKGIKFNFEQDGYEVLAAYDGRQALELAADPDLDIVILDLMIPVYNGLEVCQRIREFSQVPIIMLTAKAEDMDKIMGLEYGADDYLTKPFNILELKARVKAILRRTKSTQKKEKTDEVLDFRGIKIEYSSRRVHIGDKEIILTAKEFDLLDLFMNNPGRVYSRENLLDVVWGYEYPGDIRTVDVHVRRLREKIELDPSSPEYIQTKWGVGYYFKDED